MENYVNEKMKRLGAHRSVIRELFEYANKRRAEIGEENVFDFSIGNPSAPTPAAITEEMLALLKNTPPERLHAYTSAQGAPGVREKIADYIQNTFHAPASKDLIYVTCGASAGLAVTLSALLNDGDEAIVFAPFFPEYKVFIEGAGGKMVSVKCKATDFSIDFEALSRALTPKTKVVIINSPNNPTGKVISGKELEKLSELLSAHEEKYGAPVYLLADEPYREIVFAGVSVPYAPLYYKNTIVCYSFSKSLTLPGERIGYVSISPEAEHARDIFDAVCGAGRQHGYVCAPSLLQYTIANCLGTASDMSFYENNRDLLYSSLTSYGYECCRPEGAFYLFMKALEPDAAKFCEQAKKHELILVPSDDFYYPGYVRISYCVPHSRVKNSLPAFEALMREYKK